MNGRCHRSNSPFGNLQIHQNSKFSNQNDTMSIRSISSEDISGSIEGHCCSAEARNPAIKRGRQIQLLQMIILPFIPILALIVQTSISLNHILIYRMEVTDIENQVSVE